MPFLFRGFFFQVENPKKSGLGFILQRASNDREFSIVYGSCHCDPSTEPKVARHAKEWGPRLGVDKKLLVRLEIKALHFESSVSVNP